MNSIKKKLLILPLALLLSGCTITKPSARDDTKENPTTSDSATSTTLPETSNTSKNSSSSNTTSQDISSGDDVLMADSLYDEFFAETSKVDLTLKFKDLQTIKDVSEYGKDANSKYADIYFPADLEVNMNGKEFIYHDVGVRTKGNVFSRFELFENGKYKDGSRIHFKLKFDEFFDNKDFYKGNLSRYLKDWTGKEAEVKLRDGRAMCGFKKLDLKFNKDNDPTFLRNAYANMLLREYGVMASNVNLTKLTVKYGESTLFSDIYQAVEVINKQFLKRRLTKNGAKGDLYKLGWVGNSGADLCANGAIKKDNSGNYIADYKIGVEDKQTDKYYIYDLKTNETSSDHSSLVNLIRVLDETSAVSTYKEDLESVLDLEAFGVQQALSYVIGSPDDLRNNYNNTYLYFNPDNGKAYFLPVDFDHSLGSKDFQGTNWPTSTKLQGYQSNRGYLYQPLYWKTILVTDNQNEGNAYASKWPSSEISKKAYKDTLLSIKDSKYLTKEYFLEYVNKFPYNIGTNTVGAEFFDIEQYFNNIKTQISSDTRLASY